MKFNRLVSSSRRKNRKAKFTANLEERRIRMSSTLSSELRKRYGIRSVPIHSEDTVTVMRGALKGSQGKVLRVNRQLYKVFLDISYRNKTNGLPARYGIDPSKLMITSLSDKYGRIDSLKASLPARK